MARLQAGLSTLLYIKVESVVLAYGFDDLLVEIGSSLGLWLGLSVVGIFDVFIPSYAWLKNIVKRPNIPHQVWWRKSFKF